MITIAPDQLDDRALEVEICTTFARRDAESHRLLALIREHDARGTWCGWGIRSCAHWLMWRCGLEAGTAREKVRVARALGDLPTFDAMLRAGELSYSKVRAATRVATAEKEAELARLAKITTAAQLESVCRGIRQVEDIKAEEASRDAGEEVPARPERWVRLKNGDSGMMRLEAQLHPDECALVMEAIERARAVRTTQRDTETARDTDLALETPAVPTRDVSAETPDGPPQSPPLPTRADGLLALAERLLSTDSGELDTRFGRSGGERATLLLHLAPDILEKHQSATLEDGTRVPAETFRRIACDVGLVAVRTDDSGHVLDVGRKTRTIPPAIRRALVIRDRRCRFPGCTHTRWLDAHHIEHWAHGGETSLDNLVSLCPWHHRLVHEGGFLLEPDATSGPTFRTPEGRRIDDVPVRALAPKNPTAELAAAQASGGLCIDADTCRSHWRGERFERDWVVGGYVN